MKDLIRSDLILGGCLLGIPWPTWSQHQYVSTVDTPLAAVVGCF